MNSLLDRIPADVQIDGFKEPQGRKYYVEPVDLLQTTEFGGPLSSRWRYRDLSDTEATNRRNTGSGTRDRGGGCRRRASRTGRQRP